MLVVGVDGCPSGWVAAVHDTEGDSLTFRVFPDFGALIDAYPEAACIAVDMPIGLSDGTPRSCDREARRLLGRPRGSSVFPSPPRALLRITTHAEASARSRELFGKGIAIQAFGIYAKVAEVDDVMTPERQARVREVHPEVSFRALADGRPMAHAKKTLAGFDERRDELERVFPGAIPVTRAEARQRAPGAGADDVLDALAVAWTARRIAEGCAVSLPAEPEVGARGLRMEIVY